ncbi:MAG: hypothetical protein KAF91_31900 [Nostoc sp. TH1S01]|nr:hypothetical protein [Nostoc sp. TH1S01]
MKIKSLALATVITGACFTGVTFPVNAQEILIIDPKIPVFGCTSSTLKSEYGVQAAGTFISLPPFPSGPFGQTGRIYFDGAGKLSGNDTISVNGNILDRKLTGTYTVSFNCELSFNISDAAGNLATLKGVIVNKGQKILFIQSNPAGVVITGSAEKI